MFGHTFYSISQYNCVTYVDASFLQMFLWERLRALSLKPVKFKAVKPDKLIMVGKRADDIRYKLRGVVQCEGHREENFK